jgi:hypothetical protein
VVSGLALVLLGLATLTAWFVWAVLTHPPIDDTIEEALTYEWYPCLECVVDVWPVDPKVEQ